MSIESVLLKHAEAMNNLADALRATGNPVASVPKVIPLPVAAASEPKKPEAKAEDRVEKSEPAPVQDEPQNEPASTEPPTVEALVEFFSSYLPKNLDESERATRRAFVKKILARFNADKVTNLKPEFRAAAIRLVERKTAGEDIDPETVEIE